MVDQLNIFDLIYDKYKITKPIRLIELFSGYGSQALALKYLGVDFTHWRICEWATKSIQAYNDLHIRDYTDYSKDLTADAIVERLAAYGISMDYNKPMTLDQIRRKGEAWQRKTYNNIIATHNLVDISKAKAKDLNIINTDKYDYILTYSFPCQDLSLAGAGKGMSKGSGTRSGLLWQVERLLSELEELPQVLIMENVPAINSPKNRDDFRSWQQRLEELGYTNNVKLLNAKNYFIPQNRERCFMVSVLGNQQFNFAKEMKLINDLSTMLEHTVDDKYIISNDKIKELIKPVETEDIVLKQVAQLKNNFDSIGRVYSIDGLAPTLNTCGGGQREPKILIREATKKGYAEAHEGDSVNLEHPKSKTRRGRVGKGVAQTLLTSNNQAVVVKAGQFQPKDRDYNKKGLKREEHFEIRQDNLANCILTGDRKNCIAIKTTNKRLINLIKKVNFENDPLFLDAYNQKVNKDISGTITTRVDASNNTFIYSDLLIRKLTPKECWRLMGVKDADYSKVAANQSNSSLYHLAGDSIVTTVLMAIFGELLGLDHATKITELVEEIKQK